jgi:hypothetical protein
VMWSPRRSSASCSSMRGARSAARCSPSKRGRARACARRPRASSLAQLGPDDLVNARHQCKTFRDHSKPPAGKLDSAYIRTRALAAYAWTSLAGYQLPSAQALWSQLLARHVKLSSNFKSTRRAPRSTSRAAARSRSLTRAARSERSVVGLAVLRVRHASDLRLLFLPVLFAFSRPPFRGRVSPP